MMIGLDQKMLQTLNHDGSNGKPYVNHIASRSELYLVIPIREWNDTQAEDNVGGKATAQAQLRRRRPHMMIVGSNQDEFQGFNRDATNGMPYVTHLPNRTELFLVMPVRQWNK